MNVERLGRLAATAIAVVAGVCVFSAQDQLSAGLIAGLAALINYLVGMSTETLCQKDKS